MLRSGLVVAMIFGLGSGPQAGGGAIDNSSIDMAGYLKVASEAARHRQGRRVSEEEFLRMSREPGTLVLDARSRRKYDELHVAGAVNLSFPDIAIPTLAETIPDKGSAGSLPLQAAERVSQPVHLHRALQLRLPQPL